jgi:hypothetical protein
MGGTGYPSKGPARTKTSVREGGLRYEALPLSKRASRRGLHLRGEGNVEVLVSPEITGWDMFSEEEHLVRHQSFKSSCWTENNN